MVLGVPLITVCIWPLMLTVARLSPVGSEPLARVHVYGETPTALNGTPPLATRTEEYGCAVVQSGAELAPIATALAITRDCVAAAVLVSAPVAVNVTLEVPAAVGVPLTTPVDAASTKPVGSVVLLQAYGAAPLLAVSVNGVIAMPRYISGRAGIVTVIVGEIVIVNVFDADCCGTVESTTVTVNVAGPAVVGVPLIIPLTGSRVMPVGNAPAEIFHTNGPVPPATAS
jgi:hypothetical protein